MNLTLIAEYPNTRDLYREAIFIDTDDPVTGWKLRLYGISRDHLMIDIEQGRFWPRSERRERIGINPRGSTRDTCGSWTTTLRITGETRPAALYQDTDDLGAGVDAAWASLVADPAALIRPVVSRVVSDDPFDLPVVVRV